MLTDQSQMTKLKLDKSVLGLSDKTHTKKNSQLPSSPDFLLLCRMWCGLAVSLNPGIMHSS